MLVILTFLLVLFVSENEIISVSTFSIRLFRIRSEE